MPFRYTADAPLASWVNNQRAVNAGTSRSAILSTDQISRLNEIGFPWSIKISTEGLSWYICRRPFTLKVAWSCDDRCSHLFCCQTTEDAKALILKLNNPGSEFVISTVLRHISNISDSYLWIQSLNKKKMSELVKQVRGQLFLNDGVFKPRHLLEHASSPKRLFETAQHVYRRLSSRTTRQTIAMVLGPMVLVLRNLSILCRISITQEIWNYTLN